jgi:hypothetical protein
MNAIGLPEHRVGGPRWLPHGVRWVGGCSILHALADRVGGLNLLRTHTRTHRNLSGRGGLETPHYKYVPCNIHISVILLDSLGPLWAHLCGRGPC